MLSTIIAAATAIHRRTDMDHAPPRGNPRERSFQFPRIRLQESIVQFRVNPEYARRIASTNEVVAESVRVPAPQMEEAPPPPPPRPLSSPTVARPANSVGIIPTSQKKRKYTFELVIEVPSKRFKASRYAPTGTPPDGPTTSSSRDVPSESVEVFARSPARGRRDKLSGTMRIVRKVDSPSFDVTLDPRVRDVFATRAFMGDQFGTSYTRSYSEPPQCLIDKHGYDHFLFVAEVRTSRRRFLYYILD
jgi:hypothetical protein